MLLPSALTCDTTMPKTRYQTSLFASPPLSPPPTSSSTITNIYSTCRALQSMLTTPTQLPSPPLAHAEPPSSSTSPFKLRLRQRKGTDENSNSTGGVRKKRAPPPPPRGLNKRRRAADSDDEVDNSEDSDAEETPMIFRPSTPKRARLAPEQLPLGLDRSDFHSLHLQQVTQTQTNDQLDMQQQRSQDEALESTETNNEWSTEEDRILVELVLEKLKLSKEEWQDCARSLGKDRGSVGKRWKSLMGAGEVGLNKRGGNRRAKIHGTWR